MADDARRPQPVPFPAPAYRSLSRPERAEALTQHRKWVETEGKEGKRADLSRTDLEGVDLAGAELRRVFLRRANLRGTDLSMADLRDAWLMRADLRDACLLGTNLRGANLQGATLEGVQGLTAGWLAGANLSGADLPKSLQGFAEFQAVARAAHHARRFQILLLGLCALAVAVVAGTSDVGLLTNAASLPLFGAVLPLLGFYLVGPLLLFGLYLTFHIRLVRLWQGLADAPAVFPDGQTLDQKLEPWLLLGLVREKLRWLRRSRPQQSALEKGVARLLSYWVLPATLALLWGRYLTRQDAHGTVLHVVLVMAATAAALYFQGMAGRTLRGEDRWPRRPSTANVSTMFLRRGEITLGVGAVLAALSLGIIYGAPHAGGRGPDPQPVPVGRWAAQVLWVVGYNPYADLTQLYVSTPPPGWNGSDDELTNVAGAHLNRLNLRYAEAYRAFFVQSDLWKTDLSGAYLSEADLREANLRQANLRGAVVDRARLARANLDDAVLEKVNLARADLRGARLSYATLVGAILVDARLAGASLYGADLRAASVLRADLQAADLREANLEGAHLGHAGLEKALLLSAHLGAASLQQARLREALLIGADLQKANLQGADLEGAVLREADLTGADLSGADLQRADLRDARGLTPEQVCSAAVRENVALDDGLRAEVESRCGPLVAPETPPLPATSPR